MATVAHTNKTIIDLKRKQMKQRKLHHQGNESLNEIVVPDPTVVQQIKSLEPSRWIRAIKSDASNPQLRVLLLRLNGFGDHQIANQLGPSYAKVRRCRKELISCFKRKFNSTKDLLETMCPESL